MATYVAFGMDVIGWSVSDLYSLWLIKLKQVSNSRQFKKKNISNFFPMVRGSSTNLSNS